MIETILKYTKIIAVLLLFLAPTLSLSANEIGITPITIRGGQMITPKSAEEKKEAAESSTEDIIAEDSEQPAADSLAVMASDSLQTIASTLSKEGGVQDSLQLSTVSADSLAIDKRKERRLNRKFFTDSMSLSNVCWTAAVLPGYGQIYNKQYWKLPIVYGALAAGITLFTLENRRYQPLKKEYDEITSTTFSRSDYLDELQGSMIRSNTRRQIYLGATIGAYVYSLADAALKYSTNDASDVKRATTLSMICPGAGQIYNGSYWKVPFVLGGFASMIYVIDWNSRGYKRFQKAYSQCYDFEQNPEKYEDGVSPDEFSGRYSADYLQDIRDSYRRNRDLCIIMLTGLYILQVIDAHVDAHLKDFDVSDDLALTIEPTVDYAYIPAKKDNCAVFGFNVGLKF